MFYVLDLLTDPPSYVSVKREYVEKERIMAGIYFFLKEERPLWENQEGGRQRDWCLVNYSCMEQMD
jgi:hypothetical protein